MASREERLARAITGFVGSMWSAYLHAAVFGLWTVANFGLLPGVPVWDPTFVMLATIASVEAIFLTTFVLITQNRMAATADRRADLDVQINLLAEHEITRLLAMTEAISRHLGIRTEIDHEVAELKQDIAPEAVLNKLADSG